MDASFRFNQKYWMMRWTLSIAASLGYTVHLISAHHVIPFVQVNKMTVTIPKPFLKQVSAVLKAIPEKRNKNKSTYIPVSIQSA